MRAKFWLLEAPDSLAQQSRRNPDGTGVGYYEEDGGARVDKQPLPAYADRRFAEEAQKLCSRTFVAHVRYASGTPVSLANTHPFEHHGRLFAHNGVVGDVGALQAELGDAMSMVHGDTDSERYFALATREIESAGDVGEGLVRAARWISERLPVFALNCVLLDGDEVWALRYPEAHELHVLERAAGGPSGERSLEHSTGRGRIRVHSDDLAGLRSVVVASEVMDDDPTWKALEPGELLHVGPDLDVTVTKAIDRPPTHQLTLAELEPTAAASQAPLSSGRG